MQILTQEEEEEGENYTKSISMSSFCSDDEDDFSLNDILGQPIERNLIIDLSVTNNELPNLTPYQPKEVSKVWTSVSSQLKENQPYDDSKDYEKVPLQLKRHHRIIIPQYTVKEKKHMDIIDDSEAYEKLPLSLKRHHQIIIPQPLIKEHKHKEIIDEFVDETIKKNPETEEIKLSLIPTFVPFKRIPIEESEDKNGNVKHSISIPDIIIRENSQHQIVEEFLEKANLNDDKDFIVKIKFEPKPVHSIWNQTSQKLKQDLITPYDDSKEYEKLPLSLKRHHKIIIPQKIIKQHKQQEIIDQFVEETIQENITSKEFELKIKEKAPKRRESDIYKQSEHKINLPIDLDSKEQIFNQFFENEFNNIESYGLLILERKRNTSWMKLQPILKASISFDPNRNYDENPILLKSVNRFLIPPKLSENEDNQRQIMRLPLYVREIINDFFKVQEGADGKVSIKVKEATKEIPQVTIEEYISNDENWIRISQMIVGENQPISSPRHQKKN